MDAAQIAAMVADREAGTPGPWPMHTVRTSCGVCHQIGPWPHKWRHGSDMSACIYDDYPSPPAGTDNMLANARRIARVPDMEATIIARDAELERLRAALTMLLPQNLGPLPERAPDSGIIPVDMTFGEIRQARAALKGGTL